LPLFRFFHKEFIWLFAAILVLLLLFLFMLRWKKKVVKRIGDKRLVKALMGSYSPIAFTIKFFLLAIAVGLGVLAVMDPRKPGGADSFQREGIDVVIVLDVSKSMLATDLDPSRLEKAKQFIAKLIDKMPTDRIGLVWFAGKSYMQMPLSLDHAAAKMYVSTVSTESVPQQGTMINEALEMAVKAFDPREARYKTIVLITDGETHDEDAVSTAKELTDQGLMINTVGLGSPAGTTLFDPATKQLKTDETGNIVVSRLNEEILRELATATNGLYTHLQNSDEAVSDLLQQFSQIEKKAFPDISNMNLKPYYFLFVIGMLVLMTLEILIPEKRRVAV
jgi:Ca-activated chloride channel homolog